MALRPIVNCATNNGDGTITAFFGYKNSNSFDVTIPVGVNNSFFPQPFDRGQPTLFLAGDYDFVFKATFNEQDVGLIWWLDGNVTSAWIGTPACP
ncbi:MAG: hypothetical protein KC443_22550 [Anaerolineales bacterium]|nr:hypothetical protein [Anaerolineales bacterium]